MSWRAPDCYAIYQITQVKVLSPEIGFQVPATLILKFEAWEKEPLNLLYIAVLVHVYTTQLPNQDLVLLSNIQLCNH